MIASTRARRRPASPGRGTRLLAAVLLAAAPLACAMPQAAPQGDANPLVGDWKTADNDRITLRPETVVQTQSGGGATALDKSTCAGTFRFEYGTKSREALADLVPAQPEMRQRLAALLVEPNYKVAQLVCDHGDQTYVLLQDRELLAIYRDGPVAAIERFSRI